MSAAFDAVIIGAGANGLAAAATLARAGKRTLLVERNAQIGGQAASIEFAPGFRVAPLALDADWAPPAVLRDLGIATPQQVDASLAVRTSDGAFLRIGAEIGSTAAAIRPFSPRDADAWPTFIETLQPITGFLEHLYQMPPIDVDAGALADVRALAGLGWRFRALGRKRMTDLLRVLPMSVEELLDDVFESGALKALVATGGIRDIRQGPRSGGTAFVLLHHRLGASPGAVRRHTYWRSGAHALVSSFEAAARSAGVTIRAGEPVTSIRVHDDAVTGVVLESGEEIGARMVVSSADPLTTCRLVDPVWLDPEFLLAVSNIKFRGCTAFVVFALDELPELSGLDDRSALHGWLSLSGETMQIERACDATKYGRIADRPHIEITSPSLRWPETAPAKRHILLARTQYLPWQLRDGALWDDQARNAFGDRIASIIAEAAPGFGDRVLQRTVLGPREIAERFGCHEGAFTHGEMMLDQILFMRPVPGWGRYAMPVRGLYLGGAGAHPGPRVPGGAGWLAARAALAGAEP